MLDGEPGHMQVEYVHSRRACAQQVTSPRRVGTVLQGRHGGQHRDTAAVRITTLGPAECPRRASRMPSPELRASHWMTRERGALGRPLPGQAAMLWGSGPCLATRCGGLRGDPEPNPSRDEGDISVTADEEAPVPVTAGDMATVSVTAGARRVPAERPRRTLRRESERGKRGRAARCGQ